MSLSKVAGQNILDKLGKKEFFCYVKQNNFYLACSFLLRFSLIQVFLLI